MNSKLVLMASSIILGLLGIICSFLPEEVLLAFGQTPTIILNLFVQILGALYFGFAIMNWMAKTVIIGGIYSKPLCIGNLAHFAIAGIALAKASLSIPYSSKYIWTLTAVYVLFALLFGLIFFTNPQQTTAL